MRGQYMVNKVNYQQKIAQLYESYEQPIRKTQTYSELIDLCTQVYNEMYEINVAEHYWDRRRGIDHDAVYYVAEFAMGLRKDLLDVLELNIKDASDFSSQLFRHIVDQKKQIVYAIEPHPDDYLGSACGLCYSEQFLTHLYTIAKTGDARDSVLLDEGERKKYKKLRKDINVQDHKKYMLPDYHYDLREKDDSIGFEEKIRAYKEQYRELKKLKKAIFDIISEASARDAYLAVPFGIVHPMHILVMAISLEYINRMSFRKNHVIFYIDHPYDFHSIFTNNLEAGKEYIQWCLGTKLSRYDHMNAKQDQIGPVVQEIYGEKHYGEFDGTLEKTLCSYYIPLEAQNDLEILLPIKSNNILFISAQAKPFYKTGGLGEVAYGFCQSIKSYVNDIRILIPHQPGADQGVFLDKFSFIYESPTSSLECEIEKRRYNNLIFYLLSIKDEDGKAFSFRQEDSMGRDFSLFCDAFLRSGLNSIDYVPSHLHCNDWQTALIPFLLKTKYKDYRPDLKVIYTIHFYGYKGIFPKKKIFSWLGLDKESCRLCITCQENCLLDKTDLLTKEDQGKLVQTPPSLLSCMKAGIEFADAVTTVSRGYAEEIQKYPDFSNVKVIGIRNGIYPPENSKTFKIPSDFNKLKEYKADRKKQLQSKTGLELQPHTPLVCMVTRLAIEKGIDMVKVMIPYILEMNAQMIIVGDDSDKENRPYANFFKKMEEKNKGAFVYREFDEELEFETYAASDILLMPSLSEACGTTQINAMQFGVVPVVSMLPSFYDTVLDYRYKEERKTKHWDKGLGFYAYKDDCWVFLEVLKEVIKIYSTQPEEWENLCCTCSSTDFSWKNGPLYEYAKLYDSL